MRNSILVSDFHLTSLLRDEYRWKVFKQIEDFAKKKRVERLFILGDLTEDKDCHEGTLVNAVVEKLAHLTGWMEIYILRGNHDGLDPKSPFFHFLNRVPNIKFISTPRLELIGTPSRRVYFMPHVRGLEDFKGILKNWSDHKQGDYLFLHATVKGALAENSKTLDSEITTKMVQYIAGRTYSGDVHVPQEVGPVKYVGSPYHVKFGDKFSPRMIHLDAKEKEYSIPLDNVRRHMLDIKDYSEVKKNKALREKDQVKVRIHLPVEHLDDWLPQRHAIIAACKDLDVELVSVEVVRVESEKGVPLAHRVKRRTIKEVLEAYIKKQKVEENLAEVGRKIIS